MAIRETIETIEAHLASVRDILDTGTANGGIQVRSGTKPTNVGDAATGTLLAFIEFTKPCGSIASGVMTMSTTSDAVIVATGTAGYARWVDGNGAVRLDTDVSSLAGSAEVRFSTLSFVTGSLVELLTAALGA